MERNEYFEKNPGPLPVPLHDAPVKPYMKIELCRLYNVSSRTFSKWLAPFADEIGTRHGKYYNVLQVQIIFSRLGSPVIVAFLLLRSIVDLTSFF